MSATNTAEVEIEFLDELPKIERSVESGVWVSRLAPLRERPGTWARVYGPTNSPHALVNNLRSGSAAGIDPEDFQFAGRMISTGETVTRPVKGDPSEGDEVDSDGFKLDEDGDRVLEEVAEKEGYVYARFLTDEQKAERDAKRAEQASGGATEDTDTDTEYEDEDE